MHLNSLCFLYTLVVASVSATSVLFIDCGNKEIKSVDVTPCTISPCIFTGGNTYTFTIQATPKTDSATALLYSNSTFINGKVYPLPTYDLCVTQVGFCPIKAGITVTATIPVPIPANVDPVVGATITTKMIGDNQMMLACGSSVVTVVG